MNEKCFGTSCVIFLFIIFSRFVIMLANIYAFVAIKYHELCKKGFRVMSKTDEIERAVLCCDNALKPKRKNAEKQKLYQ